MYSMAQYQCEANRRKYRRKLINGNEISNGESWLYWPVMKVAGVAEIGG
jgi:hypothetical protein